VCFTAKLHCAHTHNVTRVKRTKSTTRAVVGIACSLVSTVRCKRTETLNPPSTDSAEEASTSMSNAEGVALTTRCSSSEKSSSSVGAAATSAAAAAR